MDPNVILPIDSDAETSAATAVTGSDVRLSKTQDDLSQTTEHKPGCRCVSCDRWGHPYDENLTRPENKTEVAG